MDSKNLYFKQVATNNLQNVYRALIIGAGATYFLWWVMVEIFIPGSFNPLGSRLAVVAICVAVWAASYFSDLISKNIAVWFSACGWLITLHYFHLLHHNRTDINWVVGSYITIIATSACYQNERHLLYYSGWVFFLTIVAISRNPLLLETVFLPGILTILIFAYVALHSRLSWLKRSQETSVWFQSLFDSVFEGLVVHENGCIIEINEPFSAIFGYQRQELIGKHVTDLVAPASRGLALNQLSSMSEKPYQVLGLRKDGSTIDIEIRARNHITQSRSFRLATVTDISGRIKSEQDRVLFEASQRAIHMRDEFLSVASHELKTPLTNIKLQTQLALRSIRLGDAKVYDPHRVQAFVEQTDRQADRLTRLVDEMLDTCRISTGKLTIDQEEFNFAPLVQEVVSAFEASAAQARSTLHVSYPPTCLIYADRFRMEQVVSNLLSNAIKYGEGKPIEVTLESSPLEIRLTVQDHGLGLDPQNRERIFQRFERAISSRKISGLGLGLYIVKDIVEAHHGRIEVQSELGQGAKFTVSLPAIS